MSEATEKRLARFGQPVAISAGIAVVIWLVARWAGFPFIFQMFFVSYVFCGLILLLYLGAPDARLPKHPVFSIVGFLLTLTVIFVAWGYALPQYNPEFEIKRIERMKKMARMDEEDERLEEEEAALELMKQGWLEELKKDPKMIASLAAEVGLVADKAVPAVVEKTTTGAVPAVVEKATAGEVPAVVEKAAAGAAPAVVAKATAPAKSAAPSKELVEMGKQALVDYECTNCHFVGGKGGTKKRGPKLDNIGTLLTAEQMKKKILDPMYLMAEGFEKQFDEGQMPDTFGEQMSKRELKALVAYLSTLRDTSVDTPKPIFQEE